MSVDPRDFLLNTDYEMDKIIYFTEGSLSAGQSVTLSHDLGFIPLIFGVCAFSSDFSDPHSIPYEEITQNNTITFTAYAKNDRIELSYVDQNGDHPTIYYRIYGFEPDGSNATVAPTNNVAKKFVLNTDYNYCKLFQKGSVNGNTATSITHDLGYIPQTLVWGEATDYQNNKIIFPITRSDFSNIDGTQTIDGIVVTTTQIRFEATLYQYDKIHYRIYYDEA